MKLRGYETQNGRGRTLYGITNHGEKVFESLIKYVRDEVKEILQGCNAEPDFHQRKNMLFAGNCFNLKLHK